MDNFNLKEYLAENKLLKEITFADVKAAAEKKPGYEGEEGEDGFSIPYEFGTINMYNRPSGGDGTGDVGIEYESGGTTQETGFISYGKAKYIVQKSLAEGDLNEDNSLLETTLETYWGNSMGQTIGHPNQDGDLVELYFGPTVIWDSATYPTPEDYGLEPNDPNLVYQYDDTNITNYSTYYFEQPIFLPHTLSTTLSGNPSVKEGSLNLPTS